MQKTWPQTNHGLALVILVIKQMPCAGTVWCQNLISFMVKNLLKLLFSWWHHQMETFSALLDLCAGNSPVTGEYPSQWPVTQSLDISFDLHLNKRLSKQSWGWWFETPSRSLWRHCNVLLNSWQGSHKWSSRTRQCSDHHVPDNVTKRTWIDICHALHSRPSYSFYCVFL